MLESDGRQNRTADTKIFNWRGENDLNYINILYGYRHGLLGSVLSILVPQHKVIISLVDIRLL
jgi:hypothetical protein